MSAVLAETSAATDGIPALTNFLDKHQDIKFIRLLWVDIAFTTRARLVPIQHFRSLLNQRKVLSVGGNFLQVVDNEAPMNRDRAAWSVGQGCLVPDPDSIRLWPGCQTHAVVFCHFSSTTPGQGSDATDVVQRTHSLCPRSACQRSLAKLEEAGLQIDIGFEIEFSCRPSLNWQGRHPEMHQVSGLRTLEALVLPFLCEVTEYLSTSDIGVEQIYAESGPGQFELSFSPASPMAALDALILARETLWSVSRRHGIDVSFHPAGQDDNGVISYNGIHMNVSLRRDASMGAQAELEINHFIAGAFEHLESLFAFGLPHPECYRRVGSNLQAIGKYKAWGYQNRSVPVRKKRANLWEFRCLDASTNIYLFLAALTAAGADGLHRQLPLHLLDCDVDPSRISQHERLQRGVSECLPSEPNSTFQALLNSHVMQQSLGPNLLQTYIILMTAYNGKLEKIGSVTSKERHDWLAARL